MALTCVQRGSGGNIIFGRVVNEKGGTISEVCTGDATVSVRHIFDNREPSSVDQLSVVM